MSAGGLRIAILAHSTNPRGGVVHALELGDALTRLGHEAAVHAPDARGGGFFRQTLCKTVSVPASPAGAGVANLVDTRAADYVRHFCDAKRRRFDVYHAQDGISANALATLKERGLIAGFARTVHHIDDFEDARVAAMQERSIAAADELFVVSRVWRDIVLQRFGREATIVGNGVDRARFSPPPEGARAALRTRLGLGGGPVFLSIGGVEERKNTLRILQALAMVRRAQPGAQLVIAGGVSLLDHGAYRRRFAEALADLALPDGVVVVTGAVAQEDMPALYRLADALVFPSIKEGFGLVALEAMACGTPVVVSNIAPFTGIFGEDDVAWCEPFDVESIAAAMRAAIAPTLRDRFISRGCAVAARHDWRAVAEAHEPVYAKLREPAHA